MIIILTGNGKGKTTSAIGTALRTLSENKTVHIVQFLKNKDWFDSGEIKFLKSLDNQNLVIKQYGKKGWVNPQKIVEEDEQITALAFKACLDSISKRPFLMIADEILVALLFHLLTEEDIIKLIEEARSNETHLILTGRGATQNLIKQADLVTKMESVKHPFDSGTTAIKGIDY